MYTFNGTENEFELNGVTYIAKIRDGCEGCAFSTNSCGNPNLPNCSSTYREDKHSVIFIRKPETPEPNHQELKDAEQMSASYKYSLLDFSKPVQTRDGCPVRILCTDRKHPDFTVAGMWLWENEIEVYECWTAEGKYTLRDKQHTLDLIQVRKPRKHAELIKRWADDDSMRLKSKPKFLDYWEEAKYPAFMPNLDYEEILPGDPLY